MVSTVLPHFSAMARNNAWSNARLHHACAQLTSAEFAARRISFFPSLRDTLNHILLVDRCYLADLDGTGRANLPPYAAYGDPAALAEAQAESDRILIAYCDSLAEADLVRTVPIDRQQEGVYQETVQAILAHLFVHQIHHRGQAHAMLAGTEVEPPQLDEFFLASDAPARDLASDAPARDLASDAPARDADLRRLRAHL